MPDIELTTEEAQLEKIIANLETLKAAVTPQEEEDE